MDRKKTIWTAIAINAGLLAVLCIAAMTTEEISVCEKQLFQPMQERPEHPMPLFGALTEAPTASVPSPVLPIELPVSPLPIRTEEPIAHQLPPIDAEPVVPAPLPVARQAPVVQGVEIVVQKGDSLEKIARHHHTSVDALIKHNHLPSTFLKVGQRLKIPAEKIQTPKEKTVVPPVSDGIEYYTMKVGDNPWSIAMKHHLKVDELLKLNGLNEEKARKLRPGDRLRIR